MAPLLRPMFWRPVMLAVLALVIGSSGSAPLSARELFAVILRAEGQIELRRGASDTWSPVQPGAELHPGDSLRTLGQSTVTIRRADGTVLELYPLSELTLEDERSVFLLLGKLWSQFQKAVGAPRQIRTPSSVALIRGTVLGVEASEPGDSRVVVAEGLVEVTDRAGRLRENVAEGFAVRADREGRLGRLERASAMELREGRGFMERMERERQERPERADRKSDRRPERVEREGRGRDEGGVRLERQEGRRAGDRVDRLMERTQNRLPIDRLERVLDRNRNEERQDRQERKRAEERQRPDGQLPVERPQIPGDLPGRPNLP